MYLTNFICRMGRRYLDLKFALLVTLVRRYVSTKLEVSTAFLFREIGGTGRTDRQTDGQTDGVQRLMQSPREGCIKQPYDNGS